MSTAQATPLMDIAEATAELLIYSGYAPSLGDNKLKALAETLSAFLEAAGIPVDETADAAHFAAVHDQDQALAVLAKAAPFIDDSL